MVKETVAPDAYWRLTTFGEERGCVCMISGSSCGQSSVGESRIGPYLVVTDIIIAFIHTFPVRPMRERFCNILDIWDSIHEGCYRPASVTRGNSVQIN